MGEGRDGVGSKSELRWDSAGLLRYRQQGTAGSRDLRPASEGPHGAGGVGICLC